MMQQEHSPSHEKNERKKLLVLCSRLSNYLLFRILFAATLIDKRSSHGSDNHRSRRYAGKCNVESHAYDFVSTNGNRLPVKWHFSCTEHSWNDNQNSNAAAVDAHCTLTHSHTHTQTQSFDFIIYELFGSSKCNRPTVRIYSISSL